jgi:hypothetical protein
MVTKNYQILYPRLQALAAGLAIMIGVSFIYADYAYMVTWPATHPSGGIVTHTHIDGVFSGTLNTTTPYQSILLGRVNRITLQTLDTSGIEVSLEIIDQLNHTILGIGHPLPVNLATNTLIFETYETFPTIDYNTNLTLLIARVSTDLNYSLHIIAQELSPRPVMDYAYPLFEILVGYIIGLALIIIGFFYIDRIIRRLSNQW